MTQFHKYLVNVDRDLNVINVGKAFLNYIGRNSLKSLDQIVPPQDMIQLKNAVFAIDGGSSTLCCVRVRIAQGGLNWLAINIDKAEGSEELINMELIDIQYLKSEGFAARTDEMTGLLNKQVITEYAIGLTQSEYQKKFYLCLVDIDNFKMVNDTFGHMRGDETITEVSHIIRDSVGNDGFVGRIGGDEFMLVLDKIENDDQLRIVLSVIRESVEQKYKYMEEGMHITVTIGAVAYPDYAADYNELFHLADRMLYLGKVKGRNRYIIYMPEIHGDIRNGEKVIGVAHHALAETDKMQLMLSLFESFMIRRDIPVREVIEKILNAYDLDEIYIYTEDTEHATYGIVRENLDDESYQIIDGDNDMKILLNPAVQKHFNENHMAVFNIYNLKSEEDAEIVRYMKDTERRFILAYQLAGAEKGGYAVFINKRSDSRRLSEGDILDLVYFARMLELRDSSHQAETDTP